MAKTDKNAKPAGKPKRQPPVRNASELFKFTVADLAKETGLKGASVRVGLRASPFAKDRDAGAVWGWNSEKEFKEVVAYFKERSGRRPDTSGSGKTSRKGADKPAEKPAAKAADKKAADKPTRKKAA